MSLTLAGAPLVNAPGSDAFWFIGAIVLGTALIGGLTLWENARRAAGWRSDATNKIDASRYSAADLEKLLTLVREPHGARGVTRGLIAILVVVLAALALAVTIISAAPDASDLRKTIVTSLLAVLATVAGFYFGSRTAETSAANATAASTAAAASKPAEPVITKLSPSNQTPGKVIEIIGSGLSGTMAVLFGRELGTNPTVNGDSSVTVTVPQGQAGTTVPVAVITPTARSAVGQLTQFTYQ